MLITENQMTVEVDFDQDNEIASELSEDSVEVFERVEVSDSKSTFK